MDIQTLIQTGSKEQLPIEQLRALAGNAAAFGNDVVEMFAGQAERRALAAGAVLTTAETESRDILASEQRTYDRHMREAEQVRGLQRDIEARTAARGFVPATQPARPVVEPTGEPAHALPSATRMSAWLESRGGYQFVGESGASSMRLGALIHALATGNRTRLSDLERRALSEGTDSAGGFTVPEIVASRFIDRVRDALVVQRAGAQIVPMTSDVLHLARVAQPGLYLEATPTINAAVSGWKLENELIAESDLTLERATLTARTLPLLLKMSVELFEDSANVSDIVEAEMAASTALELDRVALVGTGTPPEPRGILNTTGVLTGAALGTPANWDFLVTAAGQLWAVNETPNAAIYGAALAVTLGKMKATDNQPLIAPTGLADIKQFRTAAAGAKLYLGDFTQLLIGMRTSFRVEVGREGAGAFERLQVAVRSYIRADIAVARPKAFVVLS